jgi:predicted ATPase
LAWALNAADVWPMPAHVIESHPGTFVRELRVDIQLGDRVPCTGVRCYGCSLLAEVYGQQGQPEAGLQVVVEALTLVETAEERWCEAELSRLKGRLLLQLPTPDVDQAGDCFQQALYVARHQEAKALELRAALSLSRLRQRRGQRIEARLMRTEVYSRITEGFDTADLKEAKALIEELSSS